MEVPDAGTTAGRGSGVAGGAGAGLPTRSTALAALATLVALVAMAAMAAFAVTGATASAAPPPGGPAGPRVVTVAGSGRHGYRGNGGRATAAELDRPSGIALDRAGDLFIADTDNCRVQEVPAASGVHYGIAMRAHHIFTVAGTGCGRPAAPGAIGFPTGVAVDDAGDVFIADATGNRVWELTAAGDRRLAPAARVRLLVAAAGTGTAGAVGDGGPATSAQLSGPTGVAVDGAGDLFIADTSNCRVQEVPAASGVHYGVAMRAHHIFTVAGSGTCGTAGLGGPALEAQLFTPSAVAVDAAGDLLIADRGAGQVAELATTAGVFYGQAIGAGDLAVVAGVGTYGSYLTGGLPATGPTAEINFPYGLAVAPTGDLFVTDTAEKAIREIAAADGTSFGRQVSAGDMYTVAGGVPSGPNEDGTRWITTSMSAPYGVAVDAAGDLFYSDQQAGTVREILAPR